MPKERLNEIEMAIAENRMTAAQVFTQMRQLIPKKKTKKCPFCGSNKVTMFSADDDICGDCGRWFPGT